MKSTLIEIAIGIAAVLALLTGLYFAEQYVEGRGYSRAKAEDAAAIEKQKTLAAGMLASETQKARAAEQAKKDQEAAAAQYLYRSQGITPNAGSPQSVDQMYTMDLLARASGGYANMLKSQMAAAAKAGGKMGHRARPAETLKGFNKKGPFHKVKVSGK